MIILDGNFMLHRILRIPEFMNLEHNGQWTGGIYGFLTTLHTVVSAVPPQKVVVVFDGSHSERRKNYYPEYKANRKPKDEVQAEFDKQYFKIFNHQKAIIRDCLLPALGVLPVTMLVREADDVIYQICKLYYEKEEITVVSEDKDMLQLIQHFNNVKVYRPIDKALVTAENFKEHANIALKLFLCYKALLGDKGDNIGNINGVGPKTISEVLEKVDENDPINTILSYVKEQYDQDIQKGKEPDKVSKVAKIYSNWGIFARNLELIDLSREVFSNSEVDNLKFAIDNFKPTIFVDYFNSLCVQFGFNSILKDFNFFIHVFKLMQSNTDAH